MRLLFIGDVFGRSGREALAEELPGLQKTWDPDFIVVNGENAAHGKGILPSHAKEFFDLGVDVITSGNHIWDQREIIPFIEKEPRLLRPLNFPAGTPGRGGWTGLTKKGESVTVLNLMGRLFMDDLDCPFQAVETFLRQHQLRETGPVFIDLHAEATSEKMAFAHFVDGKVAAVIGTHTHIPTADVRILEHGTAYQTDTGMTGDYDSVIGIRKDIPVHRFLKRFPGEKPQPASGRATLCGVVIDIDHKTGRSTEVKPIQAGSAF